MYEFELSLQYRIAVRDRDFYRVLEMFAPDGIMVTPLKGECDPKTYHTWLFATVKRSTVTVINAFQSLKTEEISLAVQADYEWILNNDKVIHFGGMSVFAFTPDRQKIKKTSTFYDSFLTRSHLGIANSSSSYGHPSERIR